VTKGHIWLSMLLLATIALTAGCRPAEGATPARVAAATAEATATSWPIETLQPTAIPAPSDTPEPTATPQPTVTPQPTYTPTSTSTPLPTATATATPTPADPLAGVNPKGQELLFWHASTKPHADVLRALVEEFNAGNEWGIRVRTEYGGSYNDLYRKVLAAITAGETPDLAVAYQNQVAVYARSGAIAPLDAYIASALYGLTADDREDIFASFLEADRYPEYGDQMLSFPPNRSALLMYYNVDMLKSLGYDGAPPATWDRFAEMCERAAKAGSKGFAIFEMTSSFSNMVFSRGADVISADGKRATYNGPEGVEALTLIRDLVRKGCAYQAKDQYGDQADFIAGQVLFNFGSSAGLPYYRTGIQSSKKPFEWGVAAMPHGKQVERPVVDLYGPSIAVFKGRPEKQLAAWLFLRWFTQAEPGARWAQVTGYFPIRRSSLEVASLKQYIQKEPNYARALSLLPYGVGEPRVAAWSEIRGLISDAYSAVIRGADPKKTLDKSVEKANALLAGH
jgi:ABC-type glycerol-3-phosphate transport system substrate-binding protein